MILFVVSFVCCCCCELSAFVYVCMAYYSAACFFVIFSWFFYVCCLALSFWECKYHNKIINTKISGFNTAILFNGPHRKRETEREGKQTMHKRRWKMTTSRTSQNHFHNNATNLVYVYEPFIHLFKRYGKKLSYFRMNFSLGSSSKYMYRKRRAERKSSKAFFDPKHTIRNENNILAAKKQKQFFCLAFFCFSQNSWREVFSASAYSNFNSWTHFVCAWSKRKETIKKKNNKKDNKHEMAILNRRTLALTHNLNNDSCVHYYPYCFCCLAR